jgi:uncharacterized protein
MSNAAQLNDRPKEALAGLAKRRGIRGWESMNKGDLIKALSRGTSPSKSTRSAAPVKKPSAPRVTVKAAAKVTAKRPAQRPKLSPKVKLPAKRDVPARAIANGLHRATSSTNGASKVAVKPAAPAAGKLAAGKAGAAKPAGAQTPIKELPARPSGTPTKDRIILAVNDPYWLHVMWDLSAHSIQRAEAALKQDWYGARLIIRLSDVTSQDTTSTSETPIRDIPITGDGRNWYINVPQPPRQYRVDIGYISKRGDFFVLARSNVVTPPKAGSSEALDAGWEKDPKKAERILAMSTGFESSMHPELKAVFEERLKRPLGAPKDTAFGTGATPPGSVKKFFFDIDAKLIVYGRTDPTAHLTLGNDPIDLTPGGTFFMEFSLPDSRQIIPAVATSADGVEERTIVLAVERNTKYLDPMIHDQMNEG